MGLEPTPPISLEPKWPYKDGALPLALCRHKPKSRLNDAPQTMSFHGWSETADWSDQQKDELAARLAKALAKFGVRQPPEGYVLRSFGNRNVRIYPPTFVRDTPYLEIDRSSPGVWINNVDVLKKGLKQELVFDSLQAELSLVRQKRARGTHAGILTPLLEPACTKWAPPRSEVEPMIS